MDNSKLLARVPANTLPRRFRNAARGAALTACVLGFSGGLSPASATPSSVTFTFDQVGTGAGSVSALANGGGIASIKTYMNSVLSYYGFSTPNIVNVTNGVGDNGYTADRHLVGPASGSNGCSSSSVGYDNGRCPLALWNTDWATTPDTDTTKWHLSTRDMYLTNVGGTSAGNDRISMSLTGLSITGISFDLQIFPDGSCPVGGNTSCPNTSNANWPDLNLWVNGTNLPAWNWYGIVPGIGGTYTRSPLLNPETSPQLLTTSGLISFAATSTLNLDFVDWPAKIGIDNLTIYLSQQVPEPGTLGLFGIGLAGLWSTRRRRRA